MERPGPPMNAVPLKVVGTLLSKLRPPVGHAASSLPEFSFEEMSAATEVPETRVVRHFAEQEGPSPPPLPPSLPLPAPPSPSLPL